ncbi:MAG: peptidylprolyl isomerase [Oscillospiraceae bacterium]|nr:peptidylprolyl isomerase [Oscillospiraceae bacterium]
MKPFIIAITLAAILAGLFAGCSAGPRAASEPDSSQEPSEQPQESQAQAPEIDPLAEVSLIQFSELSADEPVAVLETTHGVIKIRFFPDQAPKAVENFKGLIEQNYYNGKTFHKTVNEYMIQGGSLDGRGGGGASIFDGLPFELEWSPDLWHFRGAVSMVNTGEPESTLSQFIIIQNSEISEQTVADMQAAQFPSGVVDKYLEAGGSPHLDTKYTVFGQVIEGMETVDAIAALQASGAETPSEAVVILTATIE